MLKNKQRVLDESGVGTQRGVPLEPFDPHSGPFDMPPPSTPTPSASPAMRSAASPSAPVGSPTHGGGGGHSSRSHGGGDHGSGHGGGHGGGGGGSTPLGSHESFGGIGYRLGGGSAPPSARRSLLQSPSSQVESGRVESSPVQSSRDQSSSLPPCPYGSVCYRTNPAHFRQFSHPAQGAGQGSPCLAVDLSDDTDPTQVSAAGSAGHSSKRQRVHDHVGLGAGSSSDRGGGSITTGSSQVAPVNLCTDDDAPMLAAGTQVRLHGLNGVGMAELNGRRGVVLRFDHGTELYAVSVRKGDAQAAEVFVKSASLTARSTLS